MLNEPNLQNSTNNNESILINNIMKSSLKNIRFKFYNVIFYSNLIFILICIKNKKELYKRKDICLVTKSNNKIKQHPEILLNINKFYKNIYLILTSYFNIRNFVFPRGEKGLSRRIELDNIITIQETKIAQSVKYNKEKQIKFNLYIKSCMISKLSSKNSETILKL